MHPPNADYVEISDPGQLVEAPRVSVLMLVYNHGAYLAEAIEGVLAQRGDLDFELLLGEDASTDQSREVALSYQRRHPGRIRVICSVTNGGAFANHRRLFELARGEYLAYCEGDDYWCNPDKLAAQAQLLQESPDMAMVHADWVRARADGQRWLIRWGRSMHRRVPMRWLQGDLFGCFYYGRILRTCTVMLRRSAVQAFYDSALATVRYRFVDTVRAAFLTSRWSVGYWPQIAAVYRESPGSALRSGRASFLGFLRSGLAFDTAARRYFADRPEYPASYRWECGLGILLGALRMGDMAAVREAVSDLRAHFGPVGFIRAGVDALRLRIPSWRPHRRPQPSDSGKLPR